MPNETSGLDHFIRWHEDGTGFAVYQWGSTPIRKPIELRPGRDGGFLATRRGARRTQIHDELGHLIPMVEGDPRGPRGLSGSAVARSVSELLSEGWSLPDAIQAAAEEFACSWDRVRSLYYQWRKDSEAPSDGGQLDPNEITFERAEIWAELDKLRQARRSTSVPFNPYTVSAEEIIEVARIYEARYGMGLREALAVVGYSVEWPNLNLLVNLANGDQREDQAIGLGLNQREHHPSAR